MENEIEFYNYEGIISGKNIGREIVFNPFRTKDAKINNFDGIKDPFQIHNDHFFLVGNKNSEGYLEVYFINYQSTDTSSLILLFRSKPFASKCKSNFLIFIFIFFFF